MQPVVSVIIPTYNRADLIFEAINSVLGQDYSALDLIVVDDGSTDNTAELLKPFVESGQLRYFSQANSGQATARNLGLTQARGAFICFLDSDNLWEPGKLSAQVSYLEQHPDVDIVYGDVITIDAQGSETSRSNMARFSGQIFRQMLHDNCVSMNTTMTRRRWFDEMGGFDTSFRVADDYELWLRFSAKATYAYLPNYFARYRVFPNQISSDKERRFLSNERAIGKFLMANPTLVTAAEKDRLWSTFYARWSFYRSKAGRGGPAMAAAMKAISYNPSNIGAWRNLVLAIPRSWVTK